MSQPAAETLPLATGGSSSVRRRVVLLGAGHAHLEVLRRAREFTSLTFEFVLVAPEPFWYSGLATGMLGGVYEPSLDMIDVERLVVGAGGRFVCDRATAIQPDQHTVILASGPPLRYDVLSINLGSEVPVEKIPQLSEYGIAVKPISNLCRLREELEDRMATTLPGRPVCVVVAGGGASACEVAGNVERLARTRRGSVSLTIVTDGQRAFSALPRLGAWQARRSLERRGVRVLLNSRVARVKAGHVMMADGRSIPFDILISAIGLRPPDLIRASGLPTNPEGALLVDECLRSVADPSVFGGGDCIAYRGRPLAKVGVYAVRESPVLCDNLLAALEGRPLRGYQPQRRFLLILNLGDGTGLATWGPLSWRSRWLFRLKDRIDRRFLARYR